MKKNTFQISKKNILIGIFCMLIFQTHFAQIAVNRDETYQYYREEADFWNEKGQEFLENDEWRKALQAHTKAYNVANLIDYKEAKAEALRQQANIEARFDNKNKAEKYFLEEIKLRRNINNAQQLAKTNREIGLFFANIEGNYELAIGYLLQSFYIHQSNYKDSLQKMKQEYEAIIKVGLHLEDLTRIKKYQEEYLNLYFVQQNNFLEATHHCIDWANRYVQYKDYKNAFYFIEKAESFSKKLSTEQQEKTAIDTYKEAIYLKYDKEATIAYQTKLLAYGLLIITIGIGLAGFYWSWTKILARSKK